MTLFWMIPVEDPPRGGFGFKTQLLWHPSVASYYLPIHKSMTMERERTPAEVFRSTTLQ